MDDRNLRRLIEQLASDSWLERQQAFRTVRRHRQGALWHLLEGARGHANWRVQAACVAVLAAPAPS
jgi:hypothetical protein